MKSLNSSVPFQWGFQRSWRSVEQFGVPVDKVKKWRFCLFAVFNGITRGLRTVSTAVFMTFMFRTVIFSAVSKAFSAVSPKVDVSCCFSSMLLVSRCFLPLCRFFYWFIRGLRTGISQFDKKSTEKSWKKQNIPD